MTVCFADAHTQAKFQLHMKSLELSRPLGFWGPFDSCSLWLTGNPALGDTQFCFLSNFWIHYEAITAVNVLFLWWEQHIFRKKNLLSYFLILFSEVSNVSCVTSSSCHPSIELLSCDLSLFSLLFFLFTAFMSFTCIYYWHLMFCPQVLTSPWFGPPSVCLE